MRRRIGRSSNSSRDPVTVSHRMKVKTLVRIHRVEAALAVALPARLPARR